VGWVSSQVRHLEQALGMPMFEYVGRKLYCTAAGEEMAGCVRSVFKELERVQNSLAALEGQPAGVGAALSGSTFTGEAKYRAGL